MATGHGMLGVTMSAGTGLVVSELACGRSPSIDCAPFAAARFN
jgi:D-amino-acid dehydrogenase